MLTSSQTTAGFRCFKKPSNCNYVLMFERIPEKASKNALFMTHLYSKILESELLHSPIYGNCFMLMLHMGYDGIGRGTHLDCFLRISNVKLWSFIFLKWINFLFSSYLDFFEEIFLEKTVCIRIMC